MSKIQELNVVIVSSKAQAAGTMGVMMGVFMWGDQAAGKGDTMLGLSIRNSGNVMVVGCAGQLTAGNDARLRTLVAQSPARLLVLDLAEVRAIDAAGLGTLVDLHASAKASGKQLKLMSLTPRVEALLQLTKLSTIFEICSLFETFELSCDTTDQLHAVTDLEAPGHILHPPEAA
jgi:anti-sigma B factor antagonist